MRSFDNGGISLETMSIYRFNNGYRSKEVRNIVVKKKC